MTFDSVTLDREMRRRTQKQGFDWFKWLALAVLLIFSTYMFLWEFANSSSDLSKHALIASEFNFSDPHSITSRLAYPLWHIFVSALFQLGIPLGWAAAILCAVCKGLAYLLTRRYLTLMTRERIPGAVITLVALLLMLVTPIRIAGINDGVYHGIGSPTVWHNPTQLAVLVTALLCVPYTLHCWYAFEERLPYEGAKAVLPWRKVAVLAVLLMLSLASKPTFMQALIPAAAVFFLVQWIRHPKNSAYFLQIILAFLPSVAYFVLQYLYYTGVVVPFTSGVEFGITSESIVAALRGMLLMAAFPLFALLCCDRAALMKDKTVVLCLLMVAFSILEAMSFHETGIRENHGNFNWASMSSAFMLWVAVLPRFFDAIGDYRARAARLHTEGVAGTMTSAAIGRERVALRVRSLLFLVSFMLLIWHVYSSFYYLYYLLSTGNAF